MRVLAAAVVTLALFSPVTTGAAAAQTAPAPGPCEPRDAGGNRLLPRLDCVQLFGAPAYPDAAGMVELGRVASPFGVAVTAEGHTRYSATFDLQDLPAPDETGPNAAYVAWVMTPTLDPIVKLGGVDNGRTSLGEIHFNKFTILITLEDSAEVTERGRRLVLRGISPSSLMETHDLITQAPSAVRGPAEAMDHVPPAAGDWTMPPMHPAVPMLPGMRALRPKATPFLPSVSDLASIPEARPRQLVRLGNGGTLDLEAAPVRRTMNGLSLLLYGFNGQIPGPLIQVPEKSTIFVNFTNRLELPTTIHWHGVRLDNRFDGVPGVTQDPVQPGESFRYEIYFRDAGIYWYHPHHREDIQQELGLAGNMLVDPEPAGYFSAVNREEVLMLDDLLLDAGGVVPFGTESANYMLMGRFGNVMLVNGEPEYRLDVGRDAVVRFFLTNVSNTRTFNVRFEELPMKVVGSDIGKYEHEVLTDSLVIAPAERFIVEVRFAEAGRVALTNQVQGINHRYGGFLEEETTLGTIDVSDGRVAEDHTAAFGTLRRNEDVVADIDRYRDEFDRAPDHELVLTLETTNLPRPVEEVMRFEGIYFNPVEWTGTMPMMNWLTTGEEIRWILREPSTGLENDDIRWRFTVGDLVKIRLTNDRFAFHAMQHPMHLHGQRFLVLDQDGVRNTNLVWKDTVLLPVGSVTDILLELSNPGRWMAHCHIAEHLESGMKFVFEVGEPGPQRH